MSVRSIAVLIVVLLLAACSGGTGGPAASTESAPGATDGPDVEPTTDGSDTADPTAAAGGGDDDDGPYYAIVTIGDARFEFDMDAGNNGCTRPVVGVFTGGGYTDDANPSGSLSEVRTSGARLTFALETDDLGSSQVTIEDFASGADWWAGQGRPPELGPDEGVVEGWTETGITATGTASFIDTEALRLARLDGGSVDAVAGSFEFHCAGR